MLFVKSANPSLGDGIGRPLLEGFFLSRGLGLPHVPPVLLPVEGLEQTGAAPISANLDGLTAGYFQLDRVTEGEAVVASNHDNGYVGAEAQLILQRFLSSWVEDGVPVIVDPYAELGTPPLE